MFRVPLLGVALELDEELGFFVVVVTSVSSAGVGVVLPRVTRAGGGFGGTSGVLRVRRTTLLPALSVVCDGWDSSSASASAVAARVLLTGLLEPYGPAKQVKVIFRTFRTQKTYSLIRVLLGSTGSLQ